MIERGNFIKLLQASTTADRPEYARHIAADWLASWPGDHEVQLMLASIELEQSLYEPALERLQNIVRHDPENIEAYEMLAGAYITMEDLVRANVIRACANVLNGEEQVTDRSPSWAFHLSRALTALRKGDAQTAIVETQEALTADPDLPLPTLIAIKSRLASGDRQAAVGLAHSGHDRWPECTAFRLLIADELLRGEDVGRGVMYLHKAASEDPLGMISVRILGQDHRYKSLWPTLLSMKMNQPIPAVVAAVMGKNRLAAAAPAQSAPTKGYPESVLTVPYVKDAESEDITQVEVAVPKGPPEIVEGPPTPLEGEAFRGPDSGATSPSASSSGMEAITNAEQEFFRLAARLNTRQQRDEDRRVPAYIVLASRTHLMQSFGENKFNQLDETMIALVEVVRKRPGWTAYRLYVDDPTTLEPFNIQPADPGNAWQIKLRLADLDQSLSRRGEMIGALLIVGGENMIPFHRLPNPVDDDDEIVLSDNPYTTTDDNYFIPEWPAGRLPSDSDPDLLVQLLNDSIKNHRIAVRKISFLKRLRLWLARKFRRIFRQRQITLGYSASIWRKASLAVFKPIGEPASLLTSPPTEAGQLPAHANIPLRLSYFNLHGLEDAPEWFGQRDPLKDHNVEVDFPIAFRPEDIINSGNAPKIVFTEACYGANVLNKTVDTALCLKFLSSGSQAVVGSTKISYGSVTTPLIAADLLGRVFWEHLRRQTPVGEALRRAKLHLASEMVRRFGYIDGEDQKTLISFVLYGDPLYSTSTDQAFPGQKVIIRRKTRPTRMKTVCAKGEQTLTLDNLEPSELSRVKSIVSQYLPGMADAQCRIQPQHIYGCDDEDHVCPSQQLGVKRLSVNARETRVYTFSKHVSVGDRKHPHFARLTIDPSGKVLKFAVSR
jgi:tetratricopeptide (TPR) repeat protein